MYSGTPVSEPLDMHEMVVKQLAARLQNEDIQCYPRSQALPSYSDQLQRKFVLRCNWSEYEGKAWERG